MQDRENYLIQQLGLRHLEVEAGLFSLVNESSITVTHRNEPLAASNVIYMMLNASEPLNYVQTLESDDHQILIEGGPADYYLFYPDGTAEKKTMGRNVGNGEHLIISAPGGTAKAISLHPEADYMLGASVVTPAWTPGRTVIGAEDSFVQKYKGSAEWATETRIKELIGPNFGKLVGGENGELTLSIEQDGQIIYQSMQLSLGQVESELYRFKTVFPEKRANLITCPGAPQDIINSVQQIAGKVGIGLDQTTD